MGKGRKGKSGWMSGGELERGEQFWKGEIGEEQEGGLRKKEEWGEYRVGE